MILYCLFSTKQGRRREYKLEQKGENELKFDKFKFGDKNDSEIALLDLTYSELFGILNKIEDQLRYKDDMKLKSFTYEFDRFWAKIVFSGIDLNNLMEIKENILNWG